MVEGDIDNLLKSMIIIFEEYKINMNSKIDEHFD